MMASRGGTAGSSRYSAWRLMMKLREAHPSQVRLFKRQWRARAETVAEYFRTRGREEEVRDRRIADLEARVADLEEQLAELASELRQHR